MEAKTKDLWVFVETKADGSAKNVGLELLNPGRRLADRQGGALAAVIIGNHVDEAVKAAAAHDADKVIVVEGDEYENYSTDAYANAMYHLVEKYGPTTLMIGATPNGRDFGPRVSCRLKTGLTADCTSLDIDEESGDIARLRRALADDVRIVQLRRAVREAAESKLRNGVIDTNDLLRKITEEATAATARSAREIELVKTIYELKHTINR